MNNPHHGTLVNALVTLGYVITYLAGVFAADFIVSLFFRDGFDDTGTAIAWGLGIFFTGPGLAMAYHKLLEHFDLELSGL